MIGALSLSFLTACGFVPTEKQTAHLPPVSPFCVSRYLGRWYEQVRLPHFFESGLHNVYAEYSLNEDGTVRVLNVGTDTRGRRHEAVGTAVLASEGKGLLNVSFNWFAKAPYKVIEVDSEYQYAVVTTDSKDYFWVLAREKQMDRAVLNRLIERARVEGFETEKLIWVDQNDTVVSPDFE